MTNGRHDLGCEEISEKRLREKYLPNATEDTTLLVFRFSGLKPMFGYRDENVFYVTGFDPKMKEYKH